MRLSRGLAGLLILGAALTAAAATPAPPPFTEVFGLIQSHATGLDAARLNAAAVEGLMEKLGGQARWKAGAAASNAAPRNTVVRLFDGRFGYWRPADLEPGAGDAAVKAFAALTATNPCAGWVLDLRGVGGADFSSAAAVADVFTPTGRPMLDFGAGVQTGTAKTNAPMPLAVLVNGETRGAADALAASLRANELALLFGAHTAGEAARFEDFTLSNGAVLQIATGAVRTGDGAPIPAGGLKPDVAVAVSGAAEKSYLEDPYAGAEALPGPGRRRLTEAELVRERRGEPAQTNSAAVTAPKARTVRDPVLARALDFLNGLEILRPAGK